MNISTLKLKNLALFNRNSISDANILVYNNKQKVTFINYYNYIKQALKLKNVYLENIKVYLIGKSLILKLIIYYSSLKLSFLKKKSKLNILTTKGLNIYTKNKLFPQNFIKANSLNDAIVTFEPLNKKINNKKALNLYKIIKKSMLSLLKKKRYLLVDFIQITVLLIEAKLSIKIFTILLSQLFASLTKKSHNRFFLILKKLFKLIILDTTFNKDKTKIEGIKLKIGGRLRGKTRADVRIISVGTVPLQSSSKHIEYYKQHIFTIYGAFGLKLWVYRAKQSK